VYVTTRPVSKRSVRMMPSEDLDTPLKRATPTPHHASHTLGGDTGSAKHVECWKLSEDLMCISASIEKLKSDTRYEDLASRRTSLWVRHVLDKSSHNCHESLEGIGFPCVLSRLAAATYIFE
jgi:hypothetical protein